MLMIVTINTMIINSFGQDNIAINVKKQKAEKVKYICLPHPWVVVSCHGKCNNCGMGLTLFLKEKNAKRSNENICYSDALWRSL